MRRLVVASIFAGTAFASCSAFAWTNPTGTPPNNNVAAPINESSAAQSKNGTLGMNGLAVFGNGLLSGTSRYLNFGTTAGSTGYGIRVGCTRIGAASRGSISSGILFVALEPRLCAAQSPLKVQLIRSGALAFQCSAYYVTLGGCPRVPPLMIISWPASAGLFLEPVSSTSLFTRITTWLADAANGIGELFARVGNFGRVKH